MEQPNYYAVIPAGVRYDKRLKPMEKLIYAELTCLCQKQGYCWATNAYFAELYESSKETVSRWLSHLQDCGYIKISLDQAYENGRRITLFDGSNVNGVDEKVNPTHDENVMPPLDEKVNHNNTRVNTTSKNNIPPIPPKGESANLFAEFWKAYPLHKAKPTALKAFGKLKPDRVLLNAILAALSVQKQSSQWTRDGGQYIPHPATWLNQRRWEDEKEVAGGATGQYGTYL